MTPPRLKIAIDVARAGVAWVAVYHTGTGTGRGMIGGTEINVMGRGQMIGLTEVHVTRIKLRRQMRKRIPAAAAQTGIRTRKTGILNFNI